MMLSCISFTFRVYILAVILVTECYHYIDNDICKMVEKEGSPFTLDCEGNAIERIPKASGRVYFLDLRRCQRLQFYFEDFNGYDNLLRLDLSNIPMSSQKIGVPLNKFQKLMKLTLFTFSDSELTDNEMWILPNKLTRYNVSGNRYVNLDLSMTPNLRTLVADNNILKNFPTLSFPIPPLEAIYLRNNPLDNMIVEDIVPLCLLNTLALKILPGSFLLTSAGACKCQRLNKWIEFFNIKGSNLDCLDIPTNVNCELHLANVKHLRAPCGDHIYLPDPSPYSPWLSIIVMLCVVGGIVSLLFVVFLVNSKTLNDSVQMETEDGVNEENLEESEEK